MLKLIVFAFIAASLSFSAGAQAQAVCPLGAKDTKLTIQRVMVNFGKFTMKAESVTRDPASTDQQIAEAVADLAIAASCAQASFESQDEDLMPAKVARLTGLEREQYVTQFKQAMMGFRTCLENFAAALNSRDFAAAEVQKKLMNDLADEAHSHF